MNVIAPLVVSQQTGNDATASRYGFPYKTLGAAKTAAVSGDTIVVADGTFNERDLLKNGVNWYFIVGTKVFYQPASSSGLDRAIFDDSAGAVTCRIDGYGEFVWDADHGNLVTTGGQSASVVWLQNSASEVSIRAYRASNGPTAPQGQDTHTILLENCTQFYGSFEILENSTAPGGAFTWFDGNFNLYSKIIPAADSSYTVWAREPAGGSTKNGYIGGDLIDNTSSVSAPLAINVNSSLYKL